MTRPFTGSQSRTGPASSAPAGAISSQQYYRNPHLILKNGFSFSRASLARSNSTEVGKVHHQRAATADALGGVDGHPVHVENELGAHRNDSQLQLASLLRVRAGQLAGLISSTPPARHSATAAPGTIRSDGTVYRSYGRQQVGSGYTGMYATYPVESSNLYYADQRMYNPGMRRFCSADP